MIDRLSTSERILGAAAVVGGLTAFIGWYGYDTATAHITVNGFRASVLGDVYFLAMTATVVLVSARAGLLPLPSRFQTASIRTAFVATALGAVVIQVLAGIATGASLHKGIGIAFLCAVATLAATRVSGRAPTRVIRASHGLDLQ